MTSIAVVGHITIDLILSRGRFVRRALGGPPTYASIGAKKLGANPIMVSKVGRDFPDEYVQWLLKQGVDLTWVVTSPTHPTTCFTLDYRDGERVLKISARCEDIAPQEVLDAIQEVESVHVGTVAGELSPAVLPQLAKRVKASTLDLQGYVRDVGEGGEVFLGKSLDPQLLSGFSAVGGSSDELMSAARCETVEEAAEAFLSSGCERVVVLKGAQGSEVYERDEVAVVPAYPVENVVDPTGAGDVYLSSLCIELSKGESSNWAYAVATATASLCVEGLGPAFPGAREEVLKRADWVFERIVRRKRPRTL